MRKRNTPFCYIPALAKHQDRFFLVRLVIGMGRFCWFRQRARTLPEADNYAGRLIEWFATAKQVGYTHFLLALWETFCFDVVRMVPLVQRREGHFQRQIGPQGWVNSFPVFIIRNRDKGLGWLGSSHAPPPHGITLGLQDDGAAPVSAPSGFLRLSLNHLFIEPVRHNFAEPRRFLLTILWEDVPLSYYEVSGLKRLSLSLHFFPQLVYNCFTNFKITFCP